jgi:hypothetical protein
MLVQTNASIRDSCQTLISVLFSISGSRDYKESRLEIVVSNGERYVIFKFRSTLGAPRYKMLFSRIRFYVNT